MKYNTFERLFSQERMNRYLLACGGNSRKAMTLYRYNLQLSQQIFTIISCFEVILRNAINVKLVSTLGSEWLKDSIMPGGRFTGAATQKDFNSISRAYNTLVADGQYNHSKNEYQKIQTLFLWMNVDSRALLYGLDHVQNICNKINELRPV